MSTLRRSMLLTVAGLGLLSLSGCFKVKTLMTVNPDGSAKITESISMSKQAQQQMEAMLAGFAQSMGAEGEDAKPKGGFLFEDSFKHKVADYGPGVTYLGMKKVEQDDMSGAIAEYAVADINKVKLAMSNKSDMPGPPGMGPGKAEGDDAGESPFLFSLRKLPNGLSELTIKSPPPKKTEEGKDHDAAEAEDNEGKTAGEEGADKVPPMMLQMFKDLEMAVVIECGKEIVETNATHVEGNRITLLKFAFAPLLEQQDKLKELQKLGPAAQDMQTLKPLLQGIEGIKFEPEQTVVVKFR